MPLNRSKELDNRGRARAYLVANKIGFIPAYHVLKSAFAADGKPMNGTHPEVPEEGLLSESDRAAIDGARAALGLEA